MKPKHLDLLIGAALTLVVLFIGGYVAFESLRTKTSQACSSRYPAPMRFSLHTQTGKPLSAIELQARVGVRDLGVVNNASVVEAAGGPSKEVLQVNLHKLPGGEDASAVARNGIEFHWSPLQSAKATSACLSYSILLADEFPFGDGGFLPGITAGVAGEGKTGDESLSVGPRWDITGKTSMAATTSAAVRHFIGRSQPLPINRWIKLEQEIVLNEPGKENGIVRLWVDGTPVVDAADVSLRAEPDVLIKGVLAAAGYRKVPAEPGTLQISPFEIAWR